MRSTLPFLALLLVACGPDADTLARETLVVTATTGPEEFLVEGHGDAPAADSLVRACDPAADYAVLVSTYDADGDGAFSDDEAEAVHDALGGHHGHHGPIHLLRLVYDLDQDGAFSDAELATLFEDFAARCDTLQAELLTRFDTDLDGALSGEELAVAAETLGAEAAAAHEAHDAHEARDGGHGRGGHDGDGEEDGRHRGWFHGAPDLTEVPDHLSEWDSDGDGTWAEAELEAFRTEMRARIRGGLPLGAHDEEATAGGADTGDTGGSDTGTSDTGGSEASDTAAG